MATFIFMRLILPILFLSFASAEAILPPVWQGVAEVRAILDSSELNQHLNSGDILESIIKNDDGWTIQTNRNSIHVKVVPEPQNMPGKEKFHIEFSQSE